MRDAKAEVGNRNYEIMTCDLFLLCRQERDEKAKSARSSIDELARFFELLRLRQTLPPKKELVDSVCPAIR